MPASGGVVPASVTTAPLTTLGPLLWTTTWYLTWAPGIAGALRKLALMLRSAAATWVVTLFVRLEPCWTDGTPQLAKSKVHRARLLIRLALGPATIESMCT